MDMSDSGRGGLDRGELDEFLQHLSTSDNLADALLSEFVVLRKSEEPQWEYAWEADPEKRGQMTPRGPRIQRDEYRGTPEEIASFPRGRRISRRPAGPWQPVTTEEPKLDPEPWKITNRASGEWVTTLPGTPDKEPWHFTHEAATFAPTDGYSQDPKDYGIEQEGGN